MVWTDSSSVFLVEVFHQTDVNFKYTHMLPLTYLQVKTPFYVYNTAYDILIIWEFFKQKYDMYMTT